MGCQKSFSATLGLLLLAGIASALPWDGLQVASCFGGTFGVVNEFDSMIETTIVLVVLIIALSYMLGSVLEKQELTLWSKLEAQNLLISGVLVLVVLGAFATACSVLSAQSSGSGAATPFKAVDNYLSDMYNKQGLDISKTLIAGSMADQMRAVSYIYWSVPVLGGSGIAYKANWRAVSQHREMLVDLQLPLLASLQIQRLAFTALNQAVLMALLPAAVLFRMFFITRDVGNFLLALSFGIFFGMPMVYLLTYQAYAKLPQPDTLGTDFPRDSPPMLDDALLRIGYLAPAAILVPNIALIIVVSFTMAGSKALRGIGA